MALERNFRNWSYIWATMIQKLVSRTQNAIVSVSMWLHDCRWQEVWCCSSGNRVLCWRSSSSPWDARLHQVCTVWYPLVAWNQPQWEYLYLKMGKHEKSGLPVFFSFPFSFPLERSSLPAHQHPNGTRQDLCELWLQRRNNLEETH